MNWRKEYASEKSKTRRHNEIGRGERLDARLTTAPRGRRYLVHGDAYADHNEQRERRELCLCASPPTREPPSRRASP